MLGKLKTDLMTKGRFFAIPDQINGKELRHYYLHFVNQRSTLNRLIRGFDEQGIPVNNAYIDVPDGKPHYYPISIGQVAIALYHDYLDSGSTESLQHFLRIANWFVENRTEDPRLGTYWLTEVPKPEYRVYQPWKSAFSQSRAMSVLLRAWQVTNLPIYLSCAKGALRVFEYDITEGGVSVRRPGEGVYYEEYVAEYPTRVLDGHMYALFGLYDVMRAVTPDVDSDIQQLAQRLWQEGLEGLRLSLPVLDMGYWVRFNNCTVPGYPADDPCTVMYLQLVCTQLRVIHRLTADDAWQQYADKWQRYITWPNIARMYAHKLRALKKLNRL